MTSELASRGDTGEATSASYNRAAGARIAVFGATGRTGRQLLVQARERGMQVNVLVRHPEKLGEFRDYVTQTEGTVTNPSAVEGVVAGCSAVLSVLGPGRDSPPGLLTTASTNMVAAMKKQGVRRLIILTNTAVEDPGDRLPQYQRILRLILTRVNGGLSRDSIAAAQITADSGLEWTLVRPPILTDGPRTDNYRVGALARGMPLRISRADVAEFMLSCLIENKFVHERPAIGGGRLH